MRINNHRRYFLQLASTAPLALATSGLVTASPKDSNSVYDRSNNFSFVLIGDTPYNTLDELTLEKILLESAPGAAFSIHVGDIKSGTEVCSDELLVRRLKLLQKSTVPLIYLPGDNEWLDCHRAMAGSYDPIERLAFLRRMAYGKFEQADTQKNTAQFNLKAQALRPEHQAWQYQGVHFASVNVPGSSNGIEVLSKPDFAAQTTNVSAWLSAVLDNALQDNARALVIALHANIGFQDGLFTTPEIKARKGYTAIQNDLFKICKAFTRPILLLHGDSHQFKVRKPDWRFPQLTRVECFGAPFTSAWVRISVQIENPDLFLVSTNHL